VNGFALAAAVAATILVVAHGGVGHVWHRAQLRDVAFKSTSIVGDADAAHRFFQVCWHLVTVLFAATAVALYAIGFGELASATALRFIAITYVGVLGVCLVYFGPRMAALLKPIPSIAGTAMVGVVVFAWLAA
jgi:hypothetical protein